ncbi:AAA family ATPase [Paucibacter sp. JuS9]|uniref:AAA family ATPase n=1 Tax=Paucibacter sp. JuS9 TaxID=3228748 RepID=UPI003756369A
MALTEPKWLSDFRRLLPVRSGFVISGRPRDLMLGGHAAQDRPIQNAHALKAAIVEAGVDFLVTYDIVSGLAFEALGATLPARTVEEFATALALPGPASAAKVAPSVFAERLFQLEGLQKARGASRFKFGVVLDYGSRLLEAAGADVVLATLLKRCDSASPVQVAGRSTNCPLVVWVDNIDEVPSWFLTSSQRIEPLSIVAASYDQRKVAVAQFAERLQALKGVDDQARTRFIDELTARSSLLSLTDLDDLTQLGRDTASTNVDELVRRYQLGDVSLSNPWKSIALRERIANAEAEIEQVVKGQRRAVTKSMDILKRAVVGLSGAQANSSPNRPRGVLFFAGPTGTGKTELAKQLAKAVFGDAEAYIRFDMSEYSSDHHEARLVGAPPGHVGYEEGGQLTRAVRANPFSVILFDEIEKAHPRILDKFLQILEDGRITDGRGQTAYFSECILIFTSNLGMSNPSITPNMPYDDLEPLVRKSIGVHFREQIGRPELLNRFGDNIVVFGFIDQDSGQQILNRNIENISRRIAEEHQLALQLSDLARRQLSEFCLADLANGGRGIGMKLESYLINPLARLMMNRTFSEVIQVTSIRLDPSTKVVEIESK